MTPPEVIDPAGHGPGAALPDAVRPAPPPAAPAGAAGASHPDMPAAVAAIAPPAGAAIDHGEEAAAAPPPEAGPHGGEHRGARRWLRRLPPLLGVLLLFGAIYVVQREFRHLKVADIARELHAIPRTALLVSAAWTLAAYGVLTFYDRLATVYAGHRVAFRRTAFASFCAYALAHNLGFSAVSGAAVRYRLYAHWGLAPLQIAKVVAFCSLTFGLGGLVLGGAILFYEPGAVPFFGTLLPHWALWGVGGLMWAVVAVYVTLARVFRTAHLFGHEIVLPGARMAVLQVLLATVDVAATAAIFYALLPAAPGLTFIRFLAVYVSSYTAGLAASLPGGIGVFDTAMMLGLNPYVKGSTAVGAILVFRLYYYVVPLFLAGSMFAGNELILRGRQMVGSRGAGAAGTPAPVGRWSEPDFAVAAATGTVALCGALLLSLGVLDSRPVASWAEGGLAGFAISAGQFVPSLLGAGLMVLAAGLSRRVTLAWGATLGVLLASAVFTAAQGEPLWIPAVLVLATLLVAPFRDAYYRHAKLLTGLSPTVSVPLVALVGCVIWLGALEPHVRFLGENSWWEVVLSPLVPNSLRVAVALAVLLLLVATWGLIRPHHVDFLDREAGRLAFAELGVASPAGAQGVVMGETGRSAIAFRREGRVLLGLGDPAGAESDRVSAIWRLRDLAAQEGMDAAVWRAGPGLLKVYGGLGLTPLPLGADGLPLPETVGDAPCGADSYLCCVAERDLGLLLPRLPGLAAAQ